MASVITIAGEKLFAAKAQANQQLDIDTFIFANVPGQDPAAPIDRSEALPPQAQIVLQQAVQQVGRINDNVVVYSTVLDSVTGPFEFNWVGLYSSVNQTLVAINHVPTVSKTITGPGAAGNTLNRNFGIEYSGIAELTGITVDPQTWQMDFTARLGGMDELTRQLAADMNGKDWFIGDGFKVVPRSTLNTFKVTAGVGYVSGLRVELAEDHILTLSSYPQFVYVDAWFDGTSQSVWKPKASFKVTNTEMDDYIDANGRPHYVHKLGTLTSATVVQDLRGGGQLESVKLVAGATFETAVQMLGVEGEKIKPGTLVTTAGFYTQTDGGGGSYLITDTDPGYGLAAHGGRFAVLCDSFDIRKFGIVSGLTLDQSDRIARMCRHADEQGIYEIDFHNFELMTPSTLHFTTGRGALIRGMAFTKVKKLKNLVIANNKAVPLVSGTCPIHFLPKDPAGSGVFALENVNFDPFVANYQLVSGEGDGMLFGFHAEWHPDAGQTWPASTRTVTGYSFDFNKVNFLTPAVSYNMSCHGFFSKKITADNLQGDYWGIFLVHHAETLIASNVRGIFRDDLHTGSGRLLVTNLIHEESEIDDSGAITRKLVMVTDSACHKKSGGEHVVYKCHRIGDVTIDEMTVKNCIGAVELYGGDTEAARRRLRVKKLEISDGGNLVMQLNAKVDAAELSRFNALKSFVIYNGEFGELTISDIKSLDNTLANGEGSADKVTIRNIGAVTDQTYGIVRAGIKVGEFVLDNIGCDVQKGIECDFGKITAKGLKVNIASDLNNFFFNSHAQSAFGAPQVKLKESSINCSGGVLMMATNPAATLELEGTRIAGLQPGVRPTFKQGVAYVKSFPWDPPSIDASAVATANVSMPGSKVGDVVSAAFSSFNQNIEFSAVVSSDDTVTLRARNLSASAINLPAGDVKVALSS